MNSKPWYLSKGILGSLVAAVVTIAGLFGLHLADLAPQILDAISKQIDATVTISGLVVAIYGRIVATKAITLGRTPPPLHLLPFALALGGGCVLMTGCAGTLPPQFNSPPAAAPLSATDTKIVEGLAAFDSPAALLSIETGSGTVTSIAMYTLIKQPSTMQSDGLLLYGSGQEMQAITGGSVGSTASIEDIFSGLKANASTTQSATNYATIAQSLDGLLSAARSYVASAAASTTNPSVAAYAGTVFADDVHAAGKGVCDVTAQYAPVTLSLRLPQRIPSQGQALTTFAFSF